MTTSVGLLELFISSLNCCSNFILRPAFIKYALVNPFLLCIFLMNILSLFKLLDVNRMKEYMSVWIGVRILRVAIKGQIF